MRRRQSGGRTRRSGGGKPKEVVLVPEGSGGGGGGRRALQQRHDRCTTKKSCRGGSGAIRPGPLSLALPPRRCRPCSHRKEAAPPKVTIQQYALSPTCLFALLYEPFQPLVQPNPGFRCVIETRERDNHRLRRLGQQGRRMSRRESRNGRTRARLNLPSPIPDGEEVQSVCHLRRRVGDELAPLSLSRSDAENGGRGRDRPREGLRASFAGTAVRRSCLFASTRRGTPLSLSSSRSAFSSVPGPGRRRVRRGEESCGTTTSVKDSPPASAEAQILPWSLSSLGGGCGTRECAGSGRAGGPPVSSRRFLSALSIT